MSMDDTNIHIEDNNDPKTSTKSLEDDPLIIIAKRILTEHIEVFKALAKYDEDNKK